MTESRPRVVVLCLAAYRVPDPAGIDPEGHDRQELYAVALSWLLRGLPADYALIAADTTVDSLDDLTPALREQLADPRVLDVVMVAENTLGSVNKGAGEHLMCRSILERHRPLLEAAETVVYYTSRHLLSFPFLYEYIERFRDYDAVVGNPPHRGSDGHEEESAPGNLCDMLFAMRSEWFVRFVESMRPELLVERTMNSEAFLHDFVRDSGLRAHVVPALGVLRYNTTYERMVVV